jgi:hypothetical protein
MLPPVAARALTIWTTLVVAAAPLPARAGDAPTESPTESQTKSPPPAPAGKPTPGPSPPAELPAPPPPVPAAATAAPVDAEAALERARAAYEYGEMEMVVDSARLVAEGRLHPTPAERAQALRFLGIGLYLTGRQEGAETAFFDLLRLRPQTRLDPTSARPDVVAFFENVRRRHAVEINEAASNRPGKSLALAFLPPLGQFQSGHKARGITIAALEALSLGGIIATRVQLGVWDKYPGHTFKPPFGTPGEDHQDTARTLKTLNYVSIAVFATTIVVGIIDGVASYLAVEPEDEGRSIADVFGRGLRF